MSIGWIDYSKSERNKVLGVLDLLTEEGTLDELGIAPVRDGFSNLFFPGTTTIQTRAKYFFIVPYILKDIELSRETSPKKLTEHLGDEEKSCAESLLRKAPDADGVIGKRSLAQGGWVKRPPSEIYWNGLKQYNIVTEKKLSISEYINVICSLKRSKANTLQLGNRSDNAEDRDQDDKNADNSFKYRFLNIPTYKSSWKEDLTLELTGEEAMFLKKQIVNSCPESMLGYILDNGIKEIVELEHYADVESIISRFPENIREDYRLSVKFADFVFLLQTIYNIMISDGENSMANNNWSYMHSIIADIADVDIELIIDKFKLAGNVGLKLFLRSSQEAMLSDNVEQLKHIIKNREVDLKGVNRAKSAHPGEFDYDAWFGGGLLEYRFGNVKTIVKDIFKGLELC